MKKIILIASIFLLAAACNQKQNQPSGNSGSNPPVTNQFELRAKDSGKTFQYPLTSRFSVILDQNKYPRANLSVSCAPSDTLGPISNIPAVAKPLYAVRYEAIKEGECDITDNGARFHIIVGEQEGNLPSPQTQIYKYIPYGFEFQYPVDFAFTAPAYGGLAEKIVQIQLPGSAYPGTNFGDADFSVSAQFYPDAAKCASLPKTENGAAAGNFYESKITYLYHGKICFELRETIHTANIGNYPPGTVTAVDKNAIWQRLDGIARTFKFD